MKQKNRYKEEASLEKKLILLKEVSLGDVEKQRMTSFLSRYVEMHPVLKERERVLREKRKKYVYTISLFGRAMPAFVVGVFFVWGGIASAESSLPGSPLYGLKTKSESLRQNLIFDQEERAHFEAGRISRRLDEAHSLIQNGAVSEEITERFARELEENMLSFRESLKNLNSKEKQMILFGIEKTCNSRLNTYKNIFTKMAESDEAIVAFLDEIALRFDLPSDYFENKDNVALTTNDGTQEDVESVLLTIQDNAPTEEEPTENKNDVKDDSESLETMQAPTVNTEQFLDSIELAPDTSELKEYTLGRIKAAEKSLGRIRSADERIQSALKKRLDYATSIYERGVLAENGNEKSVSSHSHFLQSLDAVEELLVFADVSNRKLSDSLIQFILDELAKNEGAGLELDEESIKEKPSIDFIEEKVPEIREEDEPIIREEERENPSGVDDSAETLDIGDVEELLDDIGL